MEQIQAEAEPQWYANILTSLSLHVEDILIENLSLQVAIETIQQ